MAPRRVSKVNKLDYKNLRPNDVICPICRSILIRPISLPCSHDFCSSCFEATQNANAVCPLCRVRVGSWLRSAVKAKKLVNDTYWQAIQNVFPSQVKVKLNGSLDRSEDKCIKRSNNTQSDGFINNCQTVVVRLEKVDSLVKSLQVNEIASCDIKKYNQKGKDKLVLEKKEKYLSFYNNFATKDYTCRILCQTPEEKQKKSHKESQFIMQKKNKRIRELQQSEAVNDRSNSIESECLYFKPIDYRHNPPSEGLAPVKVPTRKPNVNQHIKILAPSGQNQININHTKSAFVRLFSPKIPERRMEYCKKENIEAEFEDDYSAGAVKRKNMKIEPKVKKKLRISLKTPKTPHMVKVKDLEILSGPKERKHSQELDSCKDQLRKALQEQADFELAKILQQMFNQYSKYPTRSRVVNRVVKRKQLGIGGMLTSYKVK